MISSTRAGGNGSSSPAGFRTDLATVPRVVTWLIPRFGVYTLAAILHDWLCTEGIRSGAVTSREADGIFRRVMREAACRCSGAG
jgi:hypothetical protein